MSNSSPTARPGQGAQVLRGVGPAVLLLGGTAIAAGAALDHGPGMHGAELYFSCAAGALLATTLVLAGIAVRVRALGRAPDVWENRARFAAVLLATVALFTGVVYGQNVVLYPWSDPGPFLLTAGAYAIGIGAPIAAPTGLFPDSEYLRRPFRSRLCSTALALALVGVLGLVVAVTLPTEHTSSQAGEETGFPESVEELDWVWEPEDAQDPGDVHPTAHGAVVQVGRGVVGLDTVRGVQTWSYMPDDAEQTHVSVREGGGFVDISHESERGDHLTLETDTGRRVTPPEDSGHFIQETDDDNALLERIGAHSEDVLWRFSGEDGCVPASGEPDLLEEGEGEFAELGEVTVVPLNCGHEGVLVGLDTATGEEVWRHSGTHGRLGESAEEIEPDRVVTSRSIMPGMVPQSEPTTEGDAVMLGDSESRSDSLVVDALSGDVLYAGRWLPGVEDAGLDAELVAFSAESFTVAVREDGEPAPDPSTEASEEGETFPTHRTHFEERDWQGRILRSTEPVLRFTPLGPDQVHVMDEAVMHLSGPAEAPYTEWRAHIHPWNGSEATSVDLAPLEEHPEFDPEVPFGLSLQPLPGTVLVYTWPRVGEFGGMT